jgi:hypothetical protein
MVWYQPLSILKLHILTLGPQLIIQFTHQSKITIPSLFKLFSPRLDIPQRLLLYRCTSRLQVSCASYERMSLHGHSRDDLVLVSNSVKLIPPSLVSRSSGLEYLLTAILASALDGMLLAHLESV